jgi:hypothetical protein
MSTYQELTKYTSGIDAKVSRKGTISLREAKVIDRMANSVIRLAILQLRHSFQQTL